MKLFKKKPDEAPPSALEDVAETERWTYGRTLGTKTLTVAVVGSAVLWPVAVAYSLVSLHESATADSGQVVIEPISRGEQSLGATAENVVATWLATDRDHPEALSQFVSLAGTKLPAEGTESRNLATVSVEDLGDGGFLVTVAAEAKEGEQWMSRTYQVPMRLTDAGIVEVLSLPHVVAGPAVGAGNLGEYKNDVTSNGPVADTVSGFLNSYLAGAGDLDRFVSPDSTIGPVAPPAADAVKTTLISAAGKAPEKAADGQVLRVMARVELHADDSFKAADYQLTLTARAGRWEVSHLGLESVPPASSGTDNPDVTE